MPEGGEINKLTGLDTMGVSLVHRGANKRKFAINKSEEPMPAELKSAGLLAELIKAGHDGEGALIEAIKKANPGLGEKELDAALGAVRLLRSFPDSEIVKKATTGLEALLKGENPFAGKDKKKDGKDGEEEDPAEPDEEVEMKKGIPAEVVKSLESLPKEQRIATYKAMHAASQTAEKERIAKAEERITKAEQAAAEAKADAAKQASLFKAEQDKSRLREYIAKAEKEFPHVPGKPAELGELFKSLDDFSPKLCERVQALCKSFQEVAEKSLLFKEIGRSGQGGGGEGDSAEVKLAKAAEEHAKQQADKNKGQGAAA